MRMILERIKKPCPVNSVNRAMTLQASERKWIPGMVKQSWFLLSTVDGAQMIRGRLATSVIGLLFRANQRAKGKSLVQCAKGCLPLNQLIGVVG
jgi:hypothetical protein